MEKQVRTILLRTLGLRTYLSLVSDAYIRLIRAGFLKKQYPEIFFLKRIVKPGFVCIDIGANVGYYSSFISQYAGPAGHVYAVEPVSLFAGIFVRNTKKFALRNITLYQTALGGENKKIEMGTPVVEGVFRHGLTKVLEEGDSKGIHTYQVDMKVPDELFKSLERLDFVKCDVEGYEVYIMPHFMRTLTKFRPLVQMEISGEEKRDTIFALLKPLGYEAFRLESSVLEPMGWDQARNYEGGDFYFKAS